MTYSKEQLQLDQKMLEIKELLLSAQEIAQENGIYFDPIPTLFTKNEIDDAYYGVRNWNSSSRDC